MTVGVAQFLTIKDATGKALYKWQNYWIGQVVSGHNFAPFNVPALISQVTAGAETISIEIPADQGSINLADKGLQSYYIAQVDQYQFVPPVSGLPSSKTKVASFTGEFQSATITDTSISIEIGANLDSTESQVPVRTFTTILAGSPPKL